MPAMHECIDEYGGLIWSLARRLGASPSDAEDAVQEVFIALWENAERFDPAKGAEVTFVAMIARRRLIDRGRRRGRQDRLVAEVRERAGELSSSEEMPALSTVEEVKIAREAMSRLSGPQQKVLGLAIHQGCTHEQIARITELPLGTVKTHARRGLMRIRELLEESTGGARASAGS
jgi:RNA polymerase sigma-70 factor (ECF subfamily)